MKSEKEVERLYNIISSFSDGCFMEQKYRNGIMDALSFVLCQNKRLEKISKRFREPVKDITSFRY